MSKVITVTGISGSGSKDFCSLYQEKRGGVKIYHTGDMIYELAQNYPEEPPIPPEHIPSLHPKQFESLRDKVFDQILLGLDRDKEKYERIVVDTHAQFLWNDVLQNAYNEKYLNQIGADMYVTIIDKPSSIKTNQRKTDIGRSQNHDLRDLLLWQNVEVNVTQGWASNSRKPMYVLPTKQDPITMDSLLNNCFCIYFQMPMTEASGEDDKRISRFKKKLLDVGIKINGLPTPIFDPRDIDIETGKGLSSKMRRTIDRQTVHRDLNWYISQATDLIAYYPRGTNISKGISDESTRGFETGKNVFVIYDSDNASPFMGIATKVFRTEKEFFNFFPDYMEKRLKCFKRERWDKTL